MENYIFNEQEKLFYNAVVKEFASKGVNSIVEVSALSNGMLVYSTPSVGQIGRVKIRGRKTKMQFLRLNNDYLDVQWLEDLSVDEMIAKVYKWAEYAKEEEKRKRINLKLKKKTGFSFSAVCPKCKKLTKSFDETKREKADANMSILSFAKKILKPKENCVVGICTNCGFRWVID